MMLVPLGCPDDAGHPRISTNTRSTSLPENSSRRGPKRSVVSVDRPAAHGGRAPPKRSPHGILGGLDQTALSLKPWWRVKRPALVQQCERSHTGSDAAASKWRAPGDKFYSPENAPPIHGCRRARTQWHQRRQRILRSLTKRRMFNQRGRLTAIAIR